MLEHLSNPITLPAWSFVLAVVFLVVGLASRVQRKEPTKPFKI